MLHNFLENRRRSAISSGQNQPKGMSAKMATNGIRTYARTNHMTAGFEPMTTSSFKIKFFA